MPLGRGRSQSAMSDPMGGYAEIQEGNRDMENYSGIKVGLLTYNDPSETGSTYSQCNFDEAYKKRFGGAPGEHPTMVGYHVNANLPVVPMAQGTMGLFLLPELTTPSFQSAGSKT